MSQTLRAIAVSRQMKIVQLYYGKNKLLSMRWW